MFESCFAFGLVQGRGSSLFVEVRNGGSQLRMILIAVLDSIGALVY